ncbi:hypothetical protein A4A49_12451 [Nicotiana attenuata]|uniref:Uncharacterized protein n=1 Tax=Nicotiana attenuata TaxID=49451 RepID=A0A314LFY4_NICAT|nr:hypothetical protein A4A49_12451 [Nicotiana attenuata]
MSILVPFYFYFLAASFFFPSFHTLLLSSVKITFIKKILFVKITVFLGENSPYFLSVFGERAGYNFIRMFPVE